MLIKKRSEGGQKLAPQGVPEGHADPRPLAHWAYRRATLPTTMPRSPVPRPSSVRCSRLAKHRRRGRARCCVCVHLTSGLETCLLSAMPQRIVDITSEYGALVEDPRLRRANCAERHRHADGGTFPWCGRRRRSVSTRATRSASPTPRRSASARRRSAAATSRRLTRRGRERRRPKRKLRAKIISKCTDAQVECSTAAGAHQASAAHCIACSPRPRTPNGIVSDGYGGRTRPAITLQAGGRCRSPGDTIMLDPGSRRASRHHPHRRPTARRAEAASAGARSSPIPAQ